jgi:2-isopropylmalate synthase
LSNETKKKIELLDSTMRDGAQAEGISFSVNDKLNILRTLDAFGIDYIEAGNPGSNPKDLEFFKAAAGVELKNAKLCAFGSTCRKAVHPKEDEGLASLLAAQTPVVSIFGKASSLHVSEILRISKNDNLIIVRDSVAYLKSAGKTVFFDAEHFFDGYKTDPDYAMAVLRAAVSGGADRLVLCDTNGGSMPTEIADITKSVCEALPGQKIGIHCHNDSGCAVANSMLAVVAGAVQVQGTFNGIGERCGNADLSVLLPNLKLKYGYDCGGELYMLFDVARKIAEISNVSIENNRPYTGTSAFAHKAGMHIDGVLKLPFSFEHIDPELVGNKRRFLLSEVAGRSTVLSKIHSIAPELNKDSPKTAEILDRLKELEYQGYHFEAADASFELMVKKTLGTYSPHFKLVLYKTMGEFPVPEGGMPASASIKVEVNGREEMTAALGNGPVNALDIALRKALTVFYPQIAETQLTDYKVRVLEQNSSTDARVRVLIETSDDKNTWTTVGVSNDILEASLIALVDSLEYKLSQS